MSLELISVLSMFSKNYEKKLGWIQEIICLTLNARIKGCLNKRGVQKTGGKLRLLVVMQKFPKIGKLILYFIFFMHFWSVKHLKTPQVCLFQHIWSIYKRGAETKIPKK